MIGGTGFIGGSVARLLHAAGHQITVMHRGNRSARAVPEGVEQVTGDRNDGLPDHFEADAVIDMICMTARQAEQLVRSFRGRAARLVVISSADVYRAHDVLHNHDREIQPAPIGENAELRRTPYPYRGVRIPGYDWVPEDGDKILVEQVLSASADPPATVLRLPMVYGPGDPLHRFRQHIQQMDSAVPEIVIDESMAAWKGCWGYIENVAAAIVLATTDDRARGRTYNVADRGVPDYHGLLSELARITGFSGRITPLPADRLPAELRLPFNYRQSWETDTTRIRQELGFCERIGLTEALAVTVGWEREAQA